MNELRRGILRAHLDELEDLTRKVAKLAADEVTALNNTPDCIEFSGAMEKARSGIWDLRAAEALLHDAHARLKLARG